MQKASQVKTGPLVVAAKVAKAVLVAQVVPQETKAVTVEKEQMDNLELQDKVVL